MSCILIKSSGILLIHKARIKQTLYGHCMELRKFQSIAIIIRSLFFSYVCIIVRSSSALWTVEPWWSLRLGYSYLDKDKPDNLSVLYIIMSNLYSSTTGRVVCSEDINTAKQTNPVKNSQHRINGYV